MADERLLAVPGTYPANDRLDHPRNVVLLQPKQVRGFTVHREAVGVIVVLHGTDEAPVPGHDVGELRRERGRLCYPAWTRALGPATFPTVPRTLLTAHCSLC